MNGSVITALLTFAALIIGGAIGFLFGSIQNAALVRNEQLKESGSLRSGWVTMPGSMSRVALLLIALIIVQICCPLLFEGNIQWLVSAGVILGYGWTSLKRIRRSTLYRSETNRVKSW